MEGIESQEGKNGIAFKDWFYNYNSKGFQLGLLIPQKNLVIQHLQRGLVLIQSLWTYLRGLFRSHQIILAPQTTLIAQMELCWMVPGSIVTLIDFQMKSITSERNYQEIIHCQQHHQPCVVDHRLYPRRMRLLLSITLPGTNQGEQLKHMKCMLESATRQSSALIIHIRGPQAGSSWYWYLQQGNQMHPPYIYKVLYI